MYTNYIYNWSILKVKLSLWLIIQTPHHEDMLRSGSVTPSFLTSALEGGEWSALRPCRFTPEERAHSTHWIESWVGSGAGLDAVEKRKFACPCRESKPGLLACSLVAMRTELSRFWPFPHRSLFKEKCRLVPVITNNFSYWNAKFSCWGVTWHIFPLTFSNATQVHTKWIGASKRYISLGATRIYW
jgi:hypothetical protein